MDYSFLRDKVFSIHQSSSLNQKRFHRSTMGCEGKGRKGKRRGEENKRIAEERVIGGKEAWALAFQSMPT
jgi:hypothetical protein